MSYVHIPHVQSYVNEKNKAKIISNQSGGCQSPVLRASSSVSVKFSVITKSEVKENFHSCVLFHRLPMSQFCGG